MKRSNTLVLILAFVTVALLTIFSQDSSNAARQGAGDHLVYLPYVTAPLPPVIPDTTEVLDEETTQHLTNVSEDMTRFTFSQTTPELEELDPGDVMVGGLSDAAPYGFLRQVTSVDTTNGQVTVTTNATTLEDAIQQGAISHRQRLMPADIASSTMARGVTLRRPTAPGDSAFTYGLHNVVLYDLDGDLSTTGDQVTANGTITLETSYNFTLHVSNWEIEYLSFTREDVETAELSIEANLERKVNEVRQIAQHTFSPITVQVGWLPVVMVPVLEVNVGVDGALHVNVTSSVTQQATLRTGLAYEDGTWYPVSDFSNDFAFIPPTLSATLDVRGYTEAQFRLMLYGVVGPYAEVEPYLLLEADINAEPWWTLSAGIDVPVGVKIEVLGNSIADFETIPIAHQTVLAQAAVNEPPYAPSNPGPSDGAIEQNINVDLSWTGGDSDGDNVTYDVYLEAGDNTPDTLICSDVATTNCDSGTLTYDTHYYWQVVARDEHGAAATGPVWMFTTGSEPNDDPTPPSNPSPSDGATIQSTSVNLSWTGGDANGDTVTYDVYLEAGDTTPDTLLCDDTVASSCDPGNLTQATDYYWQVVARDEHGATTIGPVWGFTTEDVACARTVTSAADRGTGTLREAITSICSGGIIDFNLTFPAMITLTSGELVLTKSLTISGPGLHQLAISGNYASRVFSITTGVDVTLSGMTIRDGSVGDLYEGDGGGIHNSGNLTILDSALHNNSAGSSGGAFFNSGTLSIIRSTVSGNGSYGGWGLSIAESALLIENSILSDNNSYGGGLSAGGVATITGSTIAGNFSTLPSTVMGNVMTITNSTIVSNTFDYNPGVGPAAAGVETSGSLTLANVTFANNKGAIWNRGVVKFVNTIVSDNDSNYDNCVGTGSFVSLGHNLDTDDTCNLTDPTDLTLVDSLLGPLADNGGPTPTHALSHGSPAIDAGDNGVCPSTDQRGISRPIDGDGDEVAVCDIGAFEYDAQTDINTVPADGAAGDSFGAHVALDNDTLVVARHLTMTTEPIQAPFMPTSEAEPAGSSRQKSYRATGRPVTALARASH